MERLPGFYSFMEATTILTRGETAKANGQEPYAWLRHVLERLPTAKSVEDYEALLPWNCTPEMPR